MEKKGKDMRWEATMKSDRAEVYVWEEGSGIRNFCSIPAEEGYDKEMASHRLAALMEEMLRGKGRGW